MAFEDGRHIHLLENRSAVLHPASWDQLDALGDRDRVPPTVGFEVADDEVDTFLQASSAFVEHLVGLAHAGGIAKEHLERTGMAARDVIHGRRDSVGEHANVNTLGLADETLHRVVPNPRPAPSLAAVADKDLRHAA